MPAFLRAATFTEMGEYARQMWEGSGHLRFFLQPMLAVALGLLHGREDARALRPPYITHALLARQRPGALLRELGKALALPLAMGVGLSLLFQALNRGEVMLWTAVLFGVFFIVLPYACARSLSNRFVRRRARN